MKLQAWPVSGTTGMYEYEYSTGDHELKIKLIAFFIQKLIELN